MSTETALGTNSHSLKCLLLTLAHALSNPVRRAQDSLLHLLLVLQLGKLGADNADDDVLVLGEELQRLEAAGTLGVVLEVESVHVQVAEELLSNDVVLALGEVTATDEVTAAQMDAGVHV